ncbi:MAG TPA: YdcH family protein [Polyangiaceae bacterium]
MKPVSLEDLQRLHRSLDSEVNRLERQVYLTSGEQQQVAELKKEKLRTRDLIEDLRRS